jgi:hypothetical protein
VLLKGQMQSLDEPVLITPKRLRNPNPKRREICSSPHCGSLLQCSQLVKSRLPQLSETIICSTRPPLLLYATLSTRCMVEDRTGEMILTSMLSFQFICFRIILPKLYLRLLTKLRMVYSISGDRLVMRTIHVRCLC